MSEPMFCRGSRLLGGRRETLLGPGMATAEFFSTTDGGSVGPRSPYCHDKGGESGWSWDC